MREQPVHEEEYKGFTIKIFPDNDGESPRSWDNLGTMACWHQRYNLGDVQPPVNPEEYIKSILQSEYWRDIENSDEFEVWMKNEDNYGDVDTYIENMDFSDALKLFEKYNIYLPIHAYEHGGITISSGRFHDAFDSGQLGFIYIEKQKALKEFSQKKWSKKLEEKIYKLLEGEIETYDQYLTGDVYGYVIEQDEEDIDSCWGFYGEEDCIKEAKSIIDWKVEKLEETKKSLSNP